MDEFAKSPTGYVELAASSLAVGLPEGLMGNSEVGHLNIGAGRVVWQDVVRIDLTVKKNELSSVPCIKKICEAAKNGNGRLHLCGLVSDGGVVSSLVQGLVEERGSGLTKTPIQHSKQTHLYSLLRAAKEHGVPKVFIHFFGDGRDTEKRSGAGYMQQLLDEIKKIGVGEIATIVGRYYAMDRDKRWERVEKALNGMILGEGTESDDPVQAMKDVYARGGQKDADEFIEPIIVGGKESRIKGKPPFRLTRDY